MIAPAVSLPLETERLILREFEEADRKAVHVYASDPETVRFMTWGPNTEEQTQEFVARAIACRQDEPRRRFELAVIVKADGRLIGACSITVSDPDNRRGWIGYCYNREFWGQGYATEAARAIVGFGFEQLGLRRITATCDTENAASARVLKKAGMRREGLFREDERLRGKWRDTHSYAVLEGEWAQTR